MREIELTQGRKAIVDDEDFERVRGFKWSVSKQRGRCYAVHSFRVGGNVKMIWMHRFLMPGIKLVDHIDGNGVNNQKSNLRSASKIQNGQNRQKRKITSTPFKGVSWHTRDKVWRGKITVNGQKIELGSFDSDLDAAIVYDYAARNYFGDFARLNFSA